MVQRLEQALNRPLSTQTLVSGYKCHIAPLKVEKRG
jgi:hypothetical protein